MHVALELNLAESAFEESFASVATLLLVSYKIARMRFGD